MGITLPEVPLVLELAAPGRLPALVAGAATLLVVAALLSRRKRGLVLASVAVLIRGAAFAILAILLLEPFTRIEERRPGSLLAAIDLSRSVDDGARARAWSTLRSGVTGTPTPRRVAFGFGASTRALDPSQPALDVDDGADLSSDPTGAIDALLLGPDVGSGSARLVFASDGAIPDPRGVYLTAEPDLDGPRPLVVALGAVGATAVQAERLDVSKTPTRNRPVQLVWRGSATQSGRAVLVASVDGVEVRRMAVKIAAGPLEIPLTTPPLPGGSHVIGVHLEVEGAEDDPLDNGVATQVRIEAAPRVLVVSDTARPLVFAALKAQELDAGLIDAATLRADPFHDQDAGVVILDRVAATALSDPAVLAGLKRRVERGAGLVYLPRPDLGEMYDAGAKPFLDLLPLVGQQPPPPPEPEKPEPPKPDPEGLKPPDPEKPRDRETRKVPSLGLLLVVDSSASMNEGGRLRLAKEAAIAAAEVLHPKDFVGLIQFNRQANVVLELTMAGSKAAIIDRIARIKGRGGTDFKPALELASEVFEAESLGIRHVILLSDGRSWPARLKPLVTGMSKRGITVSTVGCGGDFDEQMLSDIALWGKGRFHPAFDAREIPQIFTIEAERVIKETGARHRRDAEPKAVPDPPQPTPDPPRPTPPSEDDPRPEPEAPKAIPFQLGLPAPYLGGVTPHDIPGLLGLHTTLARAGAWVALETTEDRTPVLAHMALGYGRVAAFALPLEGPWAGHVIGWNDYQTLLAQLVRFLHPSGERRRFHVTASGHGRAVDVRILDREARTLPAGARLALRDARGRAPSARIERVADDRFTIRLDSHDPASAVVATVVDAAGDPFPGGSNVGFASTPPPPEIAQRGLDLQGLEAWADALGGEVVAEMPPSIDVPARVTSRTVPYGAAWLPWLLLLLTVDLLLRRFWPGRLE